MKTVAYLRVSTLQQEQDGFGLKVQQQTIISYAAANAVKIDNWYQDVISGAEPERPAMDRLRDDVAAGKVGTVLIYRMDRIARSLELSEKLYKELSRKARIVSVTEHLPEGIAGNLMRQILACFAEYERATIMARTQAGRRTKTIKTGAFYGTPPYGYVFDRRSPGNLGIVPQEAALVRYVFDLNGKGLSSLKIAEVLAAGGWKSRTGGNFSPKVVRDILRRRAFYAGHAVCHRSMKADVVPHEPILVGSWDAIGAVT